MESRTVASHGPLEAKTTDVRQGRRRIDAPFLRPIQIESDVTIERQVYQTLRLSLMTGQIMPGARLTSRSLSGALGVSPTPVREALKRLEADGALVAKSKSAFFVNDPDYLAFAEILEVRLNLESLAIRKATERATDRKLEPVRELNRLYGALGDDPVDHASRALVMNFRFHFSLYSLAGSETLLKLIETLWLRVGPALHKYSSIESHRRIVGFHDQMLNAVARNDPEAAERQLRRDISTAAQSILPQLKGVPNALP